MRTTDRRFALNLMGQATEFMQDMVQFVNEHQDSPKLKAEMSKVTAPLLKEMAATMSNLVAAKKRRQQARATMRATAKGIMPSVEYPPEMRPDIRRAMVEAKAMVAAGQYKTHEEAIQHSQPYLSSLAADARVPTPGLNSAPVGTHGLEARAAMRIEAETYDVGYLKEAIAINLAKTLAPGKANPVSVHAGAQTRAMMATHGIAAKKYTLAQIDAILADKPQLDRADRMAVKLQLTTDGLLV